MKIQRKAVWTAMGFVLACSTLSALGSEDSSEPAAAAPAISADSVDQAVCPAEGKSPSL